MYRVSLFERELRKKSLSSVLDRSGLAWDSPISLSLCLDEFKTSFTVRSHAETTDAKDDEHDCVALISIDCAREQLTIELTRWRFDSSAFSVTGQFFFLG